MCDVPVQLAQAKEENSRLRDRLRHSAEDQGALRRPALREGEGVGSPPAEAL
jgi:hypothetical protein